MKHKLAVLAMAFSLLAAPAFAISLDEARASGQVGERPDGYIGAVSSAPSADVIKLVDSTNRQRKAEYQKLAAQNGQSVTVIEKLSAEKLKNERLKPGQYYMDAGGGWKKK